MNADAPLDPGVVELARGPNPASVTTLMADGSPVATLMWVDVDEPGRRLLLNTERHRLKFDNVARDPRVHLLIVDRGDTGHYASVQGKVTERVLGAAAREHIDRLAVKYTGAPFDERRIVSERVLLRVAVLHARVRQGSELVE